MLTVIDPAKVEPVIVGRGCLRRDLPNAGRLRVWIVEMAPGAGWPHVDQHDANGEQVLVIDGEMIEREVRIGPVNFLNVWAYSSHRPRTETAVRLFGIDATGGAPTSGLTR